MTDLALDELLIRSGRCPACCAKAGTCGCVILPAGFRRIGFSGLFHAEASMDAEAVAAFRDKVPCLVAGDRFVLASVDAERGKGVVVRKDAAAMFEAFTRRATR